MFGKKKNKEKKEKWWRNPDDTTELESVWGTKYKIASGLSVTFIVGLILLALSLTVFRTNVDISENVCRTILYIAIVLIIASLIGIFATLFIRIKEQKEFQRKVNKENEIAIKMRLREEEYERSLKDINTDKERLDKLKQRNEMKRKQMQQWEKKKQKQMQKEKKISETIN
ncbi:MAG: hypothetical protein LBB39_00730 [Mycoplasmataceae bacterium]|nr:hypothetical protein [Mycoplasmataceae bacterium]